MFTDPIFGEGFGDDKRDPPLDHRMLDQRWISGRFLVDCSDSDLFLHACHEKFFDVHWKLNVKHTPIEL